MKKMILAVALLAIAGAQVQTARAGDREWAVAGKVLTGVLAASVITRAVEAQPCYPYAAPAYSYSYYPAPPPVVVCAPPPPLVVYRAPVCFAPPRVVGFRVGFYGGHGHGPRWRR